MIPKKIATSALSNFSKVDMFDIKVDDYQKLISACRFYYKKDPIIASVINRLADMAATGIVIEKGNLRKNEIAALRAIVPLLQEYVRNAVREALITGLVFTEVDFKKFDKTTLRILGVKNYSSLTLPSKIWMRDPQTIEIKQGLNVSDARYFIKIPKSFIHFIMNKGEYEDGTKDKDLYNMIVKQDPELVKKIKSGETTIPITPKYKVIRRDVHSNSPYPVPYLTPIIEHAAYKRNLRRMDYAIASRVITAIMLVKIGSDKFPLTEDDEDAFDNIEMQLRAQATQSSNSSINFERIIQLFADHTLNIEWVYPPVDVLLNDKKYDHINQEILMGLGLPPVAIIGESLRSNAHNDTAAAMIPKIILDPLRNEVLFTIKHIIYDIINMNRFKGEPSSISFEPITFESIKDMVDLLSFLYDTGGLSRRTLDAKFGLDLDQELERREQEEKLLASKGLPEFPPTPHSNEPPPAGSYNKNDNQEVT